MATALPTRRKHTAPQEAGRAGEACVQRYLEGQGWQILARRWRCQWGEVDLVAYKAGLLVFVEVKTRRGQGWDQGGLLAVGMRKQQCLIRAAQAFLSQHPQLVEAACRFDVALVEYRPGGGYALVDYRQGAFEVER
ncbi:YraN family protein [Synechococcus sp. F70.1]|jgi:putative endonuclease|uniref:YraN family protein n=1 Tax=Synechococcus sp. F70.1 TaxID=2964532 RepID=UPI0039C6BA6B